MKGKNLLLLETVYDDVTNRMGALWYRILIHNAIGFAVTPCEFSWRQSEHTDRNVEL